MATGLQRSASSYRRQGSSGLVWESRYSGDLNKMNKVQGDIEFKEHRSSNSVGSINMMQRSGSTGGGLSYRSKKVSPEIDPPSPKAVGCGLGMLFGKGVKPKKEKRKGR